MFSSFLNILIRGLYTNFLLVLSLVRFSNAADIQIKICNTFKIDKYKILNSANEIKREREPWNLIYEFAKKKLRRIYMTQLSALSA